MAFCLANIFFLKNVWLSLSTHNCALTSLWNVHSCFPSFHNGIKNLRIVTWPSGRKNSFRKTMSSRDSHFINLNKLCRICGNLLGKKALVKEKYITRLNSVFFINITKDLQYIHPPKICMKCYLLMNTASKEIAPFHLKHMKNCSPMMTICAVRV